MPVRMTSIHGATTFRPSSGPTVVHRAQLALVVLAFTAAGVACGSAAKPPAAPSSPSAAISAASTASPTSSDARTDAVALLRAMGAAMGRRGKTAAIKGTVAIITTKSGVTNTARMTMSGDIAADPQALRGMGTMTAPGAGTHGFQAITVSAAGHFVSYLQLNGVPSWFKTPSGTTGFFLMTRSQVVEAMIGAGKDMSIVRTETVGGTLCNVLRVDLDLAAFDKAGSHILARAFGKSLGLSQNAAAAALRGQTGTVLLWIRRDDHLLHRLTYDFVVDLGAQGKCEVKMTKDYFDFGKTITPPITAPSVWTPAP
jgi:hypothetical protein